MKELEKIVRDRLNWDDRIDETQIEIIIKNNIAILKGCVTTYPEKLLAEIETQLVPGIESVVNKIEVKFPNSYEVPSDEAVKESMFCLLDANSEIESSDIVVNINNGDIVLEGIVNSYWKKEKIQKLISQISGVKSISNEISIIPSEEISDDEIENLIITSMQNSVHIDAHKVDIKVKKGIVTLSGTLSSWGEYKATIDIVKSIKGVINIKDKLKWIYRYYTT
ncbi:MAG: BON domain-containing protein [Candidatus Thorarchaeota archaeon]